MEVRHERPSPDTNFRLTAPLVLGFSDGESYQVKQWNLRAVYDERLHGRDLSGVVLSIPFQGVNVYFPIKLLPGDAKNEFLFDSLTGRQRETLALFYRNLLSGRMAATDDVITALDTPVDLVPMGETETERNSGAKKASPAMRTTLHLAAYIAAFLLVFGYLGSLIWSRLGYIDVPIAYIVDQTKIAPNDLLNIPGAPLTVVAPLENDLALEVWAGMHATINFTVFGQAQSVEGTVHSVVVQDATAPLGIRLVVIPDAPVDGTEAPLPAHNTPVQLELRRDRISRFFGMRSGAPAS